MTLPPYAFPSSKERPTGAVESGHLPLKAGEVAEYPRPFNPWAWFFGTLGFVLVVAVGLAVGR